METKHEILSKYKDEYFEARALKQGGRKTLTKILTTVCEVTGYDRKTAIKKFSDLQTKDPCSIDGRGRETYYTTDVTAALKDLWEVGGEMCGELLHPMIKEYATILQRDDMWKHGDEATGKLLVVFESEARYHTEDSITPAVWAVVVEMLLIIGDSTGTRSELTET